jgi:DEAD/DEAH box helicase domain-containing protein
MDTLLAEPEAALKDPYLSIGLPFHTANADGTLPFKIPNPYFSPYHHQLQAFHQLGGAAPHTALIPTGTGSGKTKCFLLPVLDYCATHQQRGIKAIIVYPMNALAIDQARRFAKEIHTRDAFRGKVRDGNFFGDSDRSPNTQMTEDFVISCKTTQHDDPPDTLLHLKNQTLMTGGAT